MPPSGLSVKDTASPGTAFRDTASRDTVSQDTVSRDIVSQDAVSQDTASPYILPRMAESGSTGSVCRHAVT